MTIRTRFDGQKILLPSALAGHAPCDIEITFVEAAKNEVGHSIWDVVGHAEGNRSAQEIIDDASRERDRWERQ
jgi:hypothetical protein